MGALLKLPVTYNKSVANKSVAFKDLLHSTYQPDTYYTSFDNLPSVISDFILKEYLALYEVENSSYTVWRDTLFIRHSAVIDGINYNLEITLGDIVDDDGCNYECDETIENVALEMLECFDWNCYDVYLEVA